MKLRKHLKNLRLENITQLGNMDRVVDFRFGSGSYTHHVILELLHRGILYFVIASIVYWHCYVHINMRY
jgi:predicted ribosome quality control (RQC) complex YloA/Tae2 family protein